MAKRRRLTPPGPDHLGTPGAPDADSEPKAPDRATYSDSGAALRGPAAIGIAPQDAPQARAPIAQVAGDASIAAAFEAVRGELQNAQREGRMVLSLPLDAVKPDYLIRDRLSCDPDEMEALKQSIRHRGQQTPIEVADLGGGQYGLISGWRRLQALAALYEDSGGLARFGHIQALLRLPKDRPAAYISMLEENEVRANLSFYERARIVTLAVEAGVFDSDKKALQSLFSTASFAKRSKVKSFMPLVRALDGALRFPAQIPERLGLALSRAIGEDAALAKTLPRALTAAASANAEEERLILERYQSGAPATKAKKQALKGASEPDGAPDPISLRFKAGRIVLEGPGVDAALRDQLQTWLAARG